MDYLDQISSRALTINLQSLKQKDKDELQKRFAEEKEKPAPSKLSKEAQGQLEAAFDDVAPKY